MDLKEGWKTTEFWASVSTSIVGLGVIFGLFTPEEATNIVVAISQVVGGCITVAPIVAYAITRGNAKSGVALESLMGYLSSFVPQSTDQTKVDPEVLADAIATAIEKQKNK